MKTLASSLLEGTPPIPDPNYQVGDQHPHEDRPWSKTELVNMVVGCLAAYPNPVDGIRDMLGSLSEEELKGIYNRHFGRPHAPEGPAFPPLTAPPPNAT